MSIRDLQERREEIWKESLLQAFQLLTHTRFILWLRPQFELQKLSAGELHHTRRTPKTPWGPAAELEPNKIPLQLIKDMRLKEHTHIVWFGLKLLPHVSDRRGKKKRKRRKRSMHAWNSMYGAKCWPSTDNVCGWLVRSGSHRLG